MRVLGLMKNRRLVIQYHHRIDNICHHHIILLSLYHYPILLMFRNVEGLGVDEEEEVGHPQERE